MTPPPLRLGPLADNDSPPPASPLSISPTLPDLIQPTNPAHRVHKRRLVEMVRRMASNIDAMNYSDALASARQMLLLLEEMHKLGHFDDTDFRYRLNGLLMYVLCRQPPRVYVSHMDTPTADTKTASVLVTLFRPSYE